MMERELIFASVQEDNTQRAYFRVRPLLSREGTIDSEEALKQWPDVGCLRIVPDRGEQHTFKDRMRSLGGYCLIDLTSQLPETSKIRNNKNYHPDRGEDNQNILYSDAVKSLSDEIFYQVFSGSADDYQTLASESITPRFLIREGDTLLGPVSRKNPEKPAAAEPMEAVLYEIDIPDVGKKEILFVAAQADAYAEKSEKAAAERRAAREAARAARMAKIGSEAAPAPIPAAEEQTTVTETEIPQPEAPAVPATPAEEALPIGESLQILDKDHSFEETLTGLNKPVSEGANLLEANRRALIAEMEPPKQTLGGTPLVKTPLRTAKVQPKNKLQEVISSQMHTARNDPPAQPLPEGAELQKVFNPVEEACAQLKKAWNLPATREQLINCMLSLEDISCHIEPTAQHKYSSSPLSRAVHNRLQELEAERLTALVQLDQAKNDLETFRKESIETAAKKARVDLDALTKDRDELQVFTSKLKEDINTLIRERDALRQEISDILKDGIPSALLARLQSCAVTLPHSAPPIHLVPGCGENETTEQILDRFRIACEKSGVNFNKNNCIAALVLFTICERVGIVTRTPASTSTLLENVCHAMGWHSSFAAVHTADQCVIAADAPADSAPCILLTGMADYAPMEHIHKLMVTSNQADMVSSVAYQYHSWPIYPIPAVKNVPAADFQKMKPLSAASLERLLDAPVPENEADQILAGPLALIPPISGKTMAELRRFVAVAASHMDGGIVSACDWAVMLWILPQLPEKKREELRPLLSAYPMSLSLIS